MENQDNNDIFDKHHDNLYKETGFWEKIQEIREGLKCDIDTGEYKYAVSERNRLFSSGFISFMVTIAIATILCLVAFSTQDQPTEPNFEVTVVEPEEVEIPPEEIPPPEEFEPPEEDIEPSDVVADTVTDVFTPEVMENPVTDTSVKPVEMTAVMQVNSPIVLRNLFANRSPGQRGEALAKFGAPAGTEDAVLKALRWLKRNQNADGSWNMGGPESAMTGLALMCYLAHGETPQSIEFGHTVETAIKYLVSQQKADGNFERTGGHHSYGNAIANYALCEAFAMTQIYTLKEICEKGIKVIVDGQQAGGTWDYDYKQGPRKDSSVMAWQAQALKAASIAGLEVEGLDSAMTNAVAGFISFQGAQGGFGYTSAGNGPLTGACVLSLQLLNKGGKESIAKGLEYMYDWRMDWDGKQYVKKSPLYHWYYITQAKFQAGGGEWTEWNNIMSPTLIKEQFPDGHWEHASAKLKSPVYSTTLACLMLEVYYRHLPTFSVNTNEDGGVAPVNEGNGDGDDVIIQIL
jgi:hypothetical protein